MGGAPAGLATGRGSREPGYRPRAIGVRMGSATRGLKRRALATPPSCSHRPATSPGPPNGRVQAAPNTKHHLALPAGASASFGSLRTVVEARVFCGIFLPATRMRRAAPPLPAGVPGENGGTMRLHAPREGAWAFRLVPDTSSAPPSGARRSAPERRDQSRENARAPPSADRRSAPERRDTSSAIHALRPAETAGVPRNAGTQTAQTHALRPAQTAGVPRNVGTQTAQTQGLRPAEIGGALRGDRVWERSRPAHAHRARKPQHLPTGGSRAGCASRALARPASRAGSSSGRRAARSARGPPHPRAAWARLSRSVQAPRGADRSPATGRPPRAPLAGGLAAGLRPQRPRRPADASPGTRSGSTGCVETGHNTRASTTVRSEPELAEAPAGRARCPFLCATARTLPAGGPCDAAGRCEHEGGVARVRRLRPRVADPMRTSMARGR